MNDKIMRFWFQDSSEYKETLAALGVSEEEYLNIIDVVLQTFPKDWVNSELAGIEKKSNFMHLELWPSLISGLRYNPIPMILARAGGYIAITQMIRLGRLILKAGQLPNKKEVIKKLMGKADDYISTLFELETLEFFSESGFSLYGPPENDGVDYTFVKDGRRVFVEATHRGISWCIEVFSKLGQSIAGVSSKKYDTCVHLNYTNARKFVNSNGVDTLVFDIDRVIAKTPEKSCTIEDKDCRFHVEFEESEEGKLTVKWHELSNYLYEVVELFKGRINEKKEQLCRNDFSLCSIDMRSLVPPVKDGRKDTVKTCVECMEKIFSESHDFLRQNRSVAGIFVWIEHYGRNKNAIIDALNHDEKILTKTDRFLSDRAAAELFPLAVLPKDITWYCEKDLFLP